MADLDRTREQWTNLLRWLLTQQSGLFLWQLRDDLLPRLLAPLGDIQARRTAESLVDAVDRSWHDRDGIAALAEQTVDRLLSALQTHLAGDSPTTDRGEGVTGPGGGSDAGPVTAGPLVCPCGRPRGGGAYPFCMTCGTTYRTGVVSDA